ncbi:MAG TPA: MBL fold metallo-hydrolase [Candidatus Bathyarchaeia archaeon]|nr:MBL fold metallo-hydrolase [Candidatus Bathyarchaeia archaeon]
MRIHSLVVGRLQTNCYILQSENEGVIIDPGDEPERILQLMKDLGLKPRMIVATHAHFDHVLGVNKIKEELRLPFTIHRGDAEILESMQARVLQFMGFSVPPPPKVDRFLKNGDSMPIGGDVVKLIHTPGHSPGSISIVGQGFVMTGDALFNRSIGRTDLPGGDLDTLVHSITGRLLTLPDDTIVYPGHGPETSIGDEKLANPFVGRMSRRVP